jgi:hypothetical protein
MNAHVETVMRGGKHGLGGRLPPAAFFVRAGGCPGEISNMTDYIFIKCNIRKIFTE